MTEISNDKKFITFQTLRRFEFDETASAPYTENDDLIILNVQLNVSFKYTMITFYWHLFVWLCSANSSHNFPDYKFVCGDEAFSISNKGATKSFISNL